MTAPRFDATSAGARLRFRRVALSSRSGVAYGNPGYPDDWRGEIFNFDQVRADELFDFRALGYRYDTNSDR